LSIHAACIVLLFEVQFEFEFAKFKFKLNLFALFQKVFFFFLSLLETVRGFAALG